jgi:putative FmdB family regulatory protein
MPTYEYKCRTCGKEFELKQSIKDDAIESCPEDICECQEKGKGEVFRKISKNIGVVFNGSGFYQTDYVNKKPAAEPACVSGDGACKN